MPDHSNLPNCSSGARRGIPRIAVLGVGNLLLRDEGLGIHVIRALADRYVLSSNVELIDGGTGGMSLLDPISNSDRLIVVDVARRGLPPGTLGSMSGTELLAGVVAKQSAHDWSLAEVLLHAEWIGCLPETTVITAEPENIEPWSDELSPALSARLPEILAAVVEAIRIAGGDCTAKPS